MLKQKLEKAINKQINAELWSAYLYLSMSAYFESLNLGGFAHWMRVQAQEEVGHAMRFYKHVIDRRGRVTVSAISSPPTTWKTPLHAFEEAFKHEQKVTAMIDDLVAIAATEKDNAAASMLKWFVDEQVEEELSTDTIVQKLKLIGTNTGGLVMLDHELGERKTK
ncbi:MAG TPA: ferritin [Candidatus Thermoplasmatota archaeon]|nr:ferritin [Candidatus Thermoplasmatota archaeon]